MVKNDTIVAVATPHGTGGIAVIRLSGNKAKEIVAKSWRGLPIDKISSHTSHLGKIISSDGEVIDEVVLTYYENPKSFTGEDVMEIACHGSLWIQREIVNELISGGARPAGPGEFTQRAFMNGKMDLAKAEGVADLIAATSKASHRLAMHQVSGSFSAKLETLRKKMIEFASLLELELDFSEEDVEFANRDGLKILCDEIYTVVSRLADSYKSGRAIKDGIPVVIAGAPNAGKSTLLNILLGEEKAIVSKIPGTTRDLIEDTIELKGRLYRFVDTAGLRHTDEEVEKIGIERANERLEHASIVLWVVDVTDKEFVNNINEAKRRMAALPESSHIILVNKVDKISVVHRHESQYPENAIFISGKSEEGIGRLLDEIDRLAEMKFGDGHEVTVTNARHYYELRQSLECLDRVREGLEGFLSADFIVQDLKEAMTHIGMITGQISTADLLNSIFQNFCIGK